MHNFMQHHPAAVLAIVALIVLGWIAVGLFMAFGMHMDEQELDEDLRASLLDRNQPVR
jgi:hypothetical protein